MTWCSASSRSITGASAGSLGAQVGEHAGVLDGVVGRDHPAVGLAVGAERPVVLPHRHRVDQRPGPAGVEAPGRDLVDQVEELRELGAQVVVDVDRGAVRWPGRGRSRLCSACAEWYVGRVRLVPGRRRHCGVRRRRGSGGPARRPARSAPRPAPRPGATCSRRAVASLGVDELAHRRRHLDPEALDAGRVVAAEDEGAGAVGQGQLGQPLGPLRVRRGVDVVEPAHLGGVATGTLGGRIDPGVALGQLLGRDVGLAGQPAVADAAGEVEHPRPDRPDPDLDVVGRRRARVHPDHPVVLPLDPQRARRGVPGRADHLDALRERGQRLSRRTTRSAGRLDRVPEPAGADPELDPAATEQVEAGDRGGEHERRAQREVRDVGGDPQGRGARQDGRDQRPRVEEPRLVGVVLERSRARARPPR